MCFITNEGLFYFDAPVINYLAVGSGRPFGTGDEKQKKKLLPGAGFKERNHIQISVRNPNCIKGYFLPRDLDKSWVNP